MKRALWVVWLLLLSACSFQEPPQTFDQARIYLRQSVYFDRNDDGDFYCGCNWQWVGSSGGRIDFSSCGYEIHSQQERAARTEWEHVVPASQFGQPMLCWRNGGRENCNRTDPVFNRMEADLHNLVPAIGEINAVRSNYRFGEIAGDPSQFGACEFEVDSSQRLAEPADAVKGQIARIYFYMSERYNLPMSESQQLTMMRWHNQFPVTQWEIERDRRIARIMGHPNPFVSQGREWVFAPEPEVAAGVRGNLNSKVYHLPEGCPSYHQISDINRVEFASEQQALAAGYRKAGNCRQ
ncbi:MAG: endonuclease [Pseudohongiella sp.]|nr:endonuclease [Pseudohongiella sp.]